MKKKIVSKKLVSKKTVKKAVKKASKVRKPSKSGKKKTKKVVVAKTDTALVVVVDRSGSMAAVKDEAEAGLNRLIDEQKAVPGVCRLSLVEFDDQIDVLYDKQNITNVNKYELVPRGMTALNDAVGVGIDVARTENAKIKIFVIVTDGCENASKKYTIDTIQSEIKALEDKGWQVVFIGQGISAALQAKTMGISVHNTLQTGVTKDATKALYSVLSDKTRSFRIGTSSAMSWDDNDRSLVK